MSVSTCSKHSMRVVVSVRDDVKDEGNHWGWGEAHTVSTTACVNLGADCFFFW